MAPTVPATISDAQRDVLHAIKVVPILYPRAPRKPRAKKKRLQRRTTQFIDGDDHAVLPLLDPLGHAAV